MPSRPAHAKDFRGKAKNIPAESMFFLPYQDKWIQDQSLMKYMVKSRRTGITYGTAYDLCRMHALKGYHTDSWVSSRDMATSLEFMVYCRKFSTMLQVAAEDMGEIVLDEKGNTAQVQRWANGSRINSAASNPDVFVGKGGNVRLDEFAVRADPKGVYEISAPVIDWGGNFGIISTHRGSGNYMAVLEKEILHEGNPKQFSYHRVTLEDALDQHFLWKLQTKLNEADPRMQMDEADYYTYQRNRCADEESFLQEYMCVPADDESAFLPYDLIASCEYSPNAR